MYTDSLGNFSFASLEHPITLNQGGLSFQLDKVRIFNCSMQEMYDLRYEDTQFITVFGVVLKLLPSLLLTVLIVALVR